VTTTDATTEGYVDTADTLMVKRDGTVAMTGNLGMAIHTINNLIDPTTAQQPATKNYVDTSDALMVKKDVTVATTGNLSMGTNLINNLGTPVATTDAATKGYVDTADALMVKKDGTVAMTHSINNVVDPTTAQQAATKSYVDTSSNTAISVVPTMTSNTTPAGYITSSLDWCGTAYPWLAFDNNTISWWDYGTTGNTTTWMQVQLPVASYVITVTLQSRSSTNAIFNWSINGSNDGINFTTLYTNAASIPATATQYTLTTPGLYSYYRLSGQYTGTTSTGLVTFGLNSIAYTMNNKPINNVVDPAMPQQAATKNYVDITRPSILYNAALQVFDSSNNGILMNTRSITLSTTATALSLTTIGSIFNNHKSNIIQLAVNQLNITANAQCTFNYSTAITVGATTGAYTITLYDVTAAASVYTVSPAPAANSTTNYIITPTFYSTANHVYELRVSCATGANISFTGG
jgi:hypothetical protein